MKAIILALTSLSLLCDAAPADEPTKVPPEFLQTNVRGWKKILDKGVSVNFDKTPLRDALSFLARKTGANFTTRFGAGTPITRNIHNMPLRTVLFLLAKDCGAQVTWELDSGFPRGIIFGD